MAARNTGSWGDARTKRRCAWSRMWSRRERTGFIMAAGIGWFACRCSRRARARTALGPRVSVACDTAPQVPHARHHPPLNGPVAAFGVDGVVNLREARPGVRGAPDAMAAPRRQLPAARDGVSACGDHLHVRSEMNCTQGAREFRLDRRFRPFSLCQIIRQRGLDQPPRCYFPPTATCKADPTVP